MAHKVLVFVHSVIARSDGSGKFLLDATCGNGHDTLFLAGQCRPGEHVFGFDLQPEAIQRTTARLDSAGFRGRATLVRDSHADLARYVPGQVRAAVFNLGYLPGSDHRVTTMPETTIPALKGAAGLTGEGGVLAVVMYRGHEGGPREAEAVLDWADGLPDGWTGVRYGFSGTKGAPPEALILTRGRRRHPEASVS